MAKITNRAAIVAYFQAKASMERDLTSRSTKYVVYKSVHTGARYYIGKAGAVRKRSETSPKHYPINEAVRQGIIRTGRKILETPVEINVV